KGQAACGAAGTHSNWISATQNRYFLWKDRFAPPESELGTVRPMRQFAARRERPLVSSSSFRAHIGRCWVMRLTPQREYSRARGCESTESACSGTSSTTVDMFATDMALHRAHGC